MSIIAKRGNDASPQQPLSRSDQPTNCHHSGLAQSGDESMRAETNSRASLPNTAVVGGQTHTHTHNTKQQPREEHFLPGLAGFSALIILLMRRDDYASAYVGVVFFFCDFDIEAAYCPESRPKCFRICRPGGGIGQDRASGRRQAPWGLQWVAKFDMLGTTRPPRCNDMFSTSRSDNEAKMDSVALRPKPTPQATVSNPLCHSRMGWPRERSGGGCALGDLWLPT